MMIRSRESVLIAVLAGALAIAPACGRKTAPLVPDSPRPAAVPKISVAVRDRIAYLSWSIPLQNVEGRPLAPEQIDRFVVFRAELTPERKKRRFREVAEIELASPSPAEIRQGAVYWADQELQYGRVYVFRVRVESLRGGMSPFSGEVIAAPLLTVARPGNPRATGGDGIVDVTWDAVVTKADGSKHDGFVGYNIYRGAAPGRLSAQPLNGEPLRTTAYRDAAVENGRNYYYVVRAVDSPVPPWRESLDSGEVSATPRDLTAPKAPSGLTAVPGIGRVFLTWNENNEADLDGYHLYRAERGAKPVKLTEKPLRRTTYSDETALPGVLYRYTVTAVDRAGNESRSSREQRASAEGKR